MTPWRGRLRPGPPSRAVVRAAVPRVSGGFDRFHLTRYVTDTGAIVRRQSGRQMADAEKLAMQRTRCVWLKNPENLRRDARPRRSGLLRLPTPSGRAALLPEDLRQFEDSRDRIGAAVALRLWRRRAAPCHLAPFPTLPRPSRPHLEGLCAWTPHRVTEGTLESRTIKGKAIRHRAFGFRATWTYIANIYHCRAGLPPP